jgi:hypothetical protein
MAISKLVEITDNDLREILRKIGVKSSQDAEKDLERYREWRHEQNVQIQGSSKADPKATRPKDSSPPEQPEQEGTDWTFVSGAAIKREFVRRKIATQIPPKMKAADVKQIYGAQLNTLDAQNKAKKGKIQKRRKEDEDEDEEEDFLDPESPPSKSKAQKKSKHN